jgi:hypothetical protein
VPTRRLRTAAFAGLPALLAFALSLFPLHNDDAGFHIATGREILHTGHVPAANPFSYANDGARWVQHQWLPAVAMAWLVDLGGIGLLVWAKALFVGVLFGAQGWWLARLRLPAGLALLLVSLGVAAAAFRFVERPYLASIAVLLATTAGLLAWRSNPTRRWPLAIAVVAPALGVHLHAGALDSLLVWGAALAAGVLELRWPPDGWRSRLPPLVAASVALLVLVAGGLWLLAPSGLLVLTLPFGFASNSYWHAHLAEFRPLALDRQALLQWPLVVAALAGGAWAVRRRSWFEAFVLLGFAALTLRHVRMVWPLATVAVPALGWLVAAEIGRPNPLPLITRRRPGAWLAGVAALLATATALDQHAAFGLRWVPIGRDRDLDAVHPVRHPLPLLDRAARLPGEVFVSDGFAGTWLWRHYEPPDRNRVLVHNCLECYREATYRDLYQRIRYGEPGWQELTARLHIATFVLKHTTQGERRFQQGRPNVRQALFADPAWVLVDWNDAGTVYTRRATLPAGTKTLDGFPVDPDTGRARPGVDEATVEAALVRHAQEHPGMLRSLDMLARRRP